LDIFLYISAVLLIFIGCAHSYLGEKYILIRLFRLDNLPRLFGSDDFTKKTLRFAWHITTIAWFGFAAIVTQLAEQSVSRSNIALIIAITFFLHFLVALIGSRGKHLSWIVFLAISAGAFSATF